MKIAVDTNVVLRYLLADDMAQALAARKIIDSATKVILPLPVLCELVWVLQRGYRLSKEEIAQAISVFIEDAKVEVKREAVSLGLALFMQGGDFADGVIAHDSLSLGAKVFVTFDKQAKRLLDQQDLMKVHLLS